MGKTIVVGGGLAGLTTAFYLSKKKQKVTLLEASPKFGGRAYSLFNPEFDDIYDNGQHVMMGCYKNTLSLINDINTNNKIEVQKALEISFVERTGKVFKLKSPKYFYPANLAIALINFKLLSFRDRLKVLGFLLDNLCCNEKDLENITVIEWLIEKKQSSESIKKLWEILIVGTLNITPEKASAQIFSEVLNEVFFSGSMASKMIIPKTGLSELFVNPIIELLQLTGNNVSHHEILREVILSKDRAKKLITSKNEYSTFDNVVLAIPPHSYEKIKFRNENEIENIIIPDFQLMMKEFNYSTILNVHLWLSENPFKEKFYAMIDSDIHWLFNHGKHISLTTSAANSFAEISNDEIISRIYSELEKYFPIFKSKLVIAHKILKEKRATFIPDCASTRLRKKIFPGIKNICFAGDWTDTNLPATIESAVLSGRLAAEEILRKSF